MEKTVTLRFRDVMIFLKQLKFQNSTTAIAIANGKSTTWRLFKKQLPMQKSTTWPFYQSNCHRKIQRRGHCAKTIAQIHDVEISPRQLPMKNHDVNEKSATWTFRPRELPMKNSRRETFHPGISNQKISDVAISSQQLPLKNHSRREF